MADVFAHLPRVLQIKVLQFFRRTQRVVVMGASGAGKTRLCALVKGRMVPRAPTQRYMVHRCRTPLYAPLKLLDCAGTFHFNFAAHDLRWLFRGTALLLVIRVVAGLNVHRACKWYLDPMWTFLRTRPWHLMLNTHEAALTDEHFVQLRELVPPPRSTWALDLDAVQPPSADITDFVNCLIHHEV